NAFTGPSPVAASGIEETIKPSALIGVDLKWQKTTLVPPIFNDVYHHKCLMISIIKVVKQIFLKTAPHANCGNLSVARSETHAPSARQPTINLRGSKICLEVPVRLVDAGEPTSQLRPNELWRFDHRRGRCGSASRP
ncbi:hypothetical protein ACE04B_40635, partial [Rhizobium phaseoli]